MKNKQKQTIALAMATALSVGAVMSPIAVYAQEADTTVIEQQAEQEEISTSPEENNDTIENEEVQDTADGGAAITEQNESSDIQETPKEETTAPQPDVQQNKVLDTPLTSMPAPIALGDVEINETNFPDEGFRAWLKQQSYGQDGILSASELAGDTLDVSGETAIEDLTGIEYFTNLIRLACDNTGITSLDVSNNTALEYLYCYGTGIASLDVSNNTALKSLDCDDTGITSLNVSKNLNLTELLCDNTGITSLDVSDNTALKYLSCDDTGITNLDVSKNTALKELYCSNCPLSWMNIGNNTNLTFSYKLASTISLEVTEDTFKISDKFTGIDQSKVTNVQGADYNSSTGVFSDYSSKTPITYEYDCGTSASNTVQTLSVTLNLTGYTDPIKINETNFPDEAFRSWLTQQRYGQDGKLTASEIAAVGNIIIPGKNIQNLSGIEYFTALTYLDCTNNNINTLNLSSNKKLTTLFCSENKLNTLDVSNNQELTTLFCHNNNLNTLLTGNAPITLLVCHHNKLTALDVDENTNLTTINAAFNEFTSLNVTRNTNLHALDVSNNQLTSLDLSTNTDVTSLTLNCNKLNTLDLTHNEKLNYLDAFENYIINVSLPDGLNFNLFRVSDQGEIWLTADENGEFDLTTLSPSFDSRKVSNLQGALSVDGKILKGLTTAPVTYTYSCGSGKTMDVTLKIKATNSWTSNLSIADWIYGEKASLPTITAKYGTPVYTYSDSKTGTFKSDVPATAGTWYVKASINEDSTYTGLLSEPIEFKIFKADSTISITGSLDKTYDETAVSDKPAVTKSGSTGAVTYQWEKKKNASDWEVIAFAPTDAGTYRVTATLASDDNYKGASSTAMEFSIAQAEPAYTAPTDLTAVYGQTLQDIALPDGFTWTDKSMSVGNAGSNTFTVTYTPDDTANYQTLTEISLKLAVTKATNAWTDNLSITGWTYGEKAKSPTAKANFGDVTFSYSDSKDGTYTDKVPTTAGTWYVKATVKGNDNYSSLESIKDFMIAQATNAWTDNLAIKGWTYGEKVNTPTAKASFGDVTFSYSNSKNGIYTDKVPTAAGTWYVKATIAGTVNYTGLETTLAFTIVPKNADNNSQIVIPDIKSDKDVENLVIKDGDKELKKGTDYDVEKKQNGNKVTVTITFKGNYTGTVTKTYTVKENTPTGSNTGTGSKGDTEKPKSSQTGDTASTGLWTMLLALSAGLTAFLTGKKRKAATKDGEELK